MRASKTKHLKSIFLSYLKKDAMSKGVDYEETQKLSPDKGSFRRFKDMINSMPYPEQAKLGI